MNKLSTPFGVAHSLTYCDPERSIVYASTSEHECYGVSLTREMPAPLANLAIVEGGWRWFEGDIAYAAVIVAFPQFFAPATVEAAKADLRNEFPSAYQKHFNVRLTPADSRRLEQAAWEDRTHNKFVACASFSDEHWNIPQGMAYVSGWRRSDESTAGFLVPAAEERAGTHRMVLDSYPRWEPDRSLPFTKAKAEVLA